MIKGIADVVVMICIISFIDLWALIALDSIYDLSFFNPIRNYKEWTSMNWFGVIFFTTLLNIICPVYALGYWFYKLCTVGRK